MEHGTRLVMAESTKFFRQKKGQWIWMYNTKTNRRSKIELQYILDLVNGCHDYEIMHFALEKERDSYRKSYLNKLLGVCSYCIHPTVVERRACGRDPPRLSPLLIEVPMRFENLNFLFLSITLFAKGILTYTPI